MFTKNIILQLQDYPELVLFSKTQTEISLAPQPFKTSACQIVKLVSPAGKKTDEQWERSRIFSLKFFEVKIGM